ncbi:MAG: DUF1294 domain-containing protein [Agathobacter sp.]|nr:DUF1294 domain-containing protein [Agathobacter sp.]
MMLIYLGLVNVAGFLAMGIDKLKAKAKAWRIPEKTLLTIAVLGGAIGVWLGMEVFRHKTKHKHFKYGVPLIFIIEVAVWFYLS